MKKKVLQSQRNFLIRECKDLEMQLEGWRAAHDNLAQQLGTSNDLLEIAVEALKHYSKRDIQWSVSSVFADEALKRLEG